MTCAVSAAVREGAEAVICASTGNTAASAAAYAARARADRRGDRARGQDRHRQARPGADARRARDRAARQLRRGARRWCASSPSATRSRSSTRSTSSGSRARRRRRSSCVEELGADLDALCIPVGNAGNITAYWKGFEEAGVAAADARLAGRGRGAARPRRAGRAPRDGRERDPDRQPGALGGGDGRDDRLARRDPRGLATREILDAYRFLAAHEGVFCEPASAAGVAGLLKHGAEGARRVACVLTGHGLKDPQTALGHAGLGRAVRAGPRRRRARRAGMT